VGYSDCWSCPWAQKTELKVTGAVIQRRNSSVSAVEDEAESPFLDTDCSVAKWTIGERKALAKTGYFAYLQLSGVGCLRRRRVETRRLFLLEGERAETLLGGAIERLPFESKEGSR